VIASPERSIADQDASRRKRRRNDNRVVARNQNYLDFVGDGKNRIWVRGRGKGEGEEGGGTGKLVSW
jgi:hypothetical protein